MRIFIYDTTLREGAQSPGTSFSLNDKLQIVTLLDQIGVDYIEAGNPTSNVKDLMLFERLSTMKLKKAKVTAFGSTTRPGIAPKDDYNINSLLKANTQAVCIFGKTSEFHVNTVLRCSLDENLKIIFETIKYLKSCNKEVIYDAEHFFDGCMQNLDYAIKTLQTAQSAGADSISLCDTNGGAYPRDVAKYTQLALQSTSLPIGIHCHDDAGFAAANTIEAVLSGAQIVQTTLCGWGERCGNANMFTVAPTLKLKLNHDCLNDDTLANLQHYYNTANEIANCFAVDNAPYVGKYAFSHKAGMHIDAVNKSPETFEHVDPKSVGASRELLLSEVSGRGAILHKVRALLPEMTKDSPFITDVLEKLKLMEMDGYQFEGAEASFELLVRRMLNLYQPFFNVVEYKVVATRPSALNHTATAMIRVDVGGKEEITAADGDGPVNALDVAVRKALELFYPKLKQMRLVDYKVRVLDSKNTTASRVRVIIQSKDDKRTWSTIGVHEDVLQASFMALADSLEYKLLIG